MTEELNDKVVAITGAARGQGLEEAKLLSSHGATVLALDVLEPEGSLPSGVSFRHLDVTSSQDWDNLAKFISSEFGQLFGLVNNAGIVGARGSAGRLANVKLEDWNSLIAINTTGPMLGIQRMTPVMSDGGSIVNISSIAGAGAHFAAAYGVSKWALRGLARIAAMELGPRGIRVNTILPGYIESPMQHDTLPVFLNAHKSLISLPRTGTPQDIAPVVQFLLSKASEWITGVDIPVDGGALGHSGLQVISDGMKKMATELGDAE